MTCYLVSFKVVIVKINLSIDINKQEKYTNIRFLHYTF